MSFFDGNGKEVEVGSKVTSAEIKKAFLESVAAGEINIGSVPGVTLDYRSPGEQWVANAKASYNKMLTAYKLIPNSGIPFFIQTDSHGRGCEPARWMNNADVDSANVTNLNLGDHVTDVFNLPQIEDMLERTKQVKRFIAVVGNHEVKMGTVAPNYFDLNRTFISTMVNPAKVRAPLNCYATYDGAHDVRWIAMDTNMIKPDGGTKQAVTTATADWLIDELTADGDLIYLSHWPCMDTYRLRTESAEKPSNDQLLAPLWKLLLARKKKQSGSYTDTDGGVHPYDFTNVRGDLLCCLHGHEHQEWVTTKDGLTAYAADWYGRNFTCTIGLIDRLGEKMTLWAWNATELLDPIELPI